MSKNILIIGASSAIAAEVAKLYAAQNANFVLWARNEQKLNVVADDLKVRGANEITTIIADVLDESQHEQYLQNAIDALGSIDVALIAHGTLPNQEECEQSLDKTMQEIAINGTSVVRLMHIIAQQLEQQNSGSLAVISSVAGDRGRQSNYTYGSAKALVSAFAEGMLSRFEGSPVHVMLVKPGFVDTPMTAEFDKGALWAQPDSVAKAIVDGIDKKKAIIYVPLFWWAIMQIIRNIPTFIFKKLSL